MTIQWPAQINYQCEMHAAHDEKVGGNTIKYTMGWVVG